MVLIYIFFTSLLQAITEFLPISSSAHLFFVSYFFNNGQDNLLFDVALHLGTALAVVVYFYKDVWALIKGFFELITFKKSKQSSFTLNVIISSIPIAIIGLLLVETNFIYLLRNSALVIFNLAFFAVVLYIADKYVTKKHLQSSVYGMSKKQAFLVGIAQALALCPGVSRSGITLSALRFAGFNRQSSAKYSMLISIPGIAGAILLLALELNSSNITFNPLDFILGVLLTFLFGILVISFLMNYVRNNSFTIFVVYRLLFAVLLLILIL